MSEKKKYDLMFVYVDNDQVYRDNLRLSDLERESLEMALEALTDSGYIYGPDGDHNSGEMLVEYSSPQFMTLGALKLNWKSGGIQDQLEDAGFVWPGSEPK